MRSSVGGKMRDETTSMMEEDVGDSRRTNANEERIFVAIRVRPLNEKERATLDVSEWDCTNGNTIRFKNSLGERSSSMDAYTFDRVFGEGCSTQQVYEKGINEVALSVVNGINSSIFAYGQTSSGKTYTMTGITEYAVRDIYDYTKMHEEREFLLKFSAVEIYNEVVRDILNPDSAPLRLLDDPEKGTVIEKLTEETLTEWRDLQRLLSICADERTTEETSMNERSSRSHQILRLTVESYPSRYPGVRSSGALRASVNFVDLAGSEQASQALTAGARVREGSYINRSLLTLGTVIRKLSNERNGHIPYRDSNLTNILHNSLGGNARTAIICTISPAGCHAEQSRNTFFFAGCAKKVATNAQVNVVMSDKVLVQQLQKELPRMQNQLRNFAPSTVLLERGLLIKQMDEEIKELSRQRDIFQSRLENLVQSGEKDSLSISSNITNIESDRTSESPDRPISGVSLDNEQHVQQHESPEHILLDNTYKIIEPEVIVEPNSDQCWDVRDGLADDDSEDNCKEVRCIEIEEVETDHQTGVTSSQKDANSSLRKEDRKLSHFAKNNNPDILQRKIQELQRTIDRLVGFSEKFNQPAYVSPLSRSRSLQFTKSKSCRATLAATPFDPFTNKVDQESTSSGQVNKLGQESRLSLQYDILEQKTMLSSQYNCNELDWKHKPPPQFDIPNMIIPALDKLEVKINDVSATEIEKECSTSLVRYQEELSEPNVHASKTKTSIDHSQTPERPDTLHEVESAMESDGDDASSVLSFFVKMEARAKETVLNKDFDDLVVLAKSSGFHDHQDRTEDVYFNELPNGLPPSDLENQKRNMIQLWHACNVPLVHRSYFFLILKGEYPDSIYLNIEIRRLSFINDAFSRGTVFLGEDGQNTSPDSSLKALDCERKMLSKQVHKKFSSKERRELYKKWCIDLRTKNRSMQLTRRIWTDTQDLFHAKQSAMLVAKLVGLVQLDEAPRKTFGFHFFSRRKSKKSKSWKDAVSNP